MGVKIICLGMKLEQIEIGTLVPKRWVHFAKILKIAQQCRSVDHLRQANNLM